MFWGSGDSSGETVPDAIHPRFLSLLFPIYNDLICSDRDQIALFKSRNYANAADYDEYNNEIMQMFIDELVTLPKC